MFRINKLINIYSHDTSKSESESRSKRESESNSKSQSQNKSKSKSNSKSMSMSMSMGMRMCMGMWIFCSQLTSRSKSTSILRQITMPEKTSAWHLITWAIKNFHAGCCEPSSFICEAWRSVRGVLLRVAITLVWGTTFEEAWIVKQYTLAKRKCNEDSTGRHFHIIPGRTRCKNFRLSPSMQRRR